MANAMALDRDFRMGRGAPPAAVASKIRAMPDAAVNVEGGGAGQTVAERS